MFFPKSLIDSIIQEQHCYIIFIKMTFNLLNRFGCENFRTLANIRDVVMDVFYITFPNNNNMTTTVGLSIFKHESLPVVMHCDKLLSCLK